jgi:diaminohydroxyphosphoribosylaminopyrimidine deaminase/5-amino-6-(5-phosphoribosylamino)uracil reductase
LKWAETADGFIARKNHDSKWISDEYSRQLVHKWRAEEDAVLVASGTAWYDNPSLNVRNWTGRNPLRIVIDRYLKLGANQHLFDGHQKTICYNLLKDDSEVNLLYVKLPEKNLLQEVIQNLYTRGVQSVIVEGGAQLLNSFIKAQLWDEARIFVAPQVFGQGIPGPQISGVIKSIQKLDNDWLKIMEPHP